MFTERSKLRLKRGECRSKAPKRPKGPVVFIRKKLYRQTRQQELNNALFKAVIKYDKAVALECIRNGAEVDHRSDSGLTPLMWACRGGLDEMAKLLIEHGADINAKDLYGRRPLDFALGEGHPGIVAMLEERGAVSDTDGA